MKKNIQQISSPLLYQLTDQEPASNLEQDPKRYIDLATLHNDIKANLENILNTRLSYFGDLNEHAELSKSILNYGMVDFSQQYYSIKKNQRELCQTIQGVIQHFEPRLQQVKVSLVENEIDVRRSFVIRILGEINIKPEPEQAVFESNLDVVSYQFTFDEELV